MTKGLVVLAAGGTGGHVFPAEALAAILQERGYDLAFFTDKRGTAYSGILGQIPTVKIHAGGIAGRSIVHRLKSVAALGLGVLEALRTLRRLRPKAVIGFGGYAALPTVLAAVMLRIPCAFHEQNAVLGRANRLLGRLVQKIALSFAETRHTQAFSQKIVHTGMPVRSNIAALKDAPYLPFDATGPIRIVVIGGSQGAKILSDAVPAALLALPAELKHRIILSQQCRPEDLGRVEAFYRGHDIKVTLQAFFDDIAERMSQAHLVISRSGSSSMAELTVLGRPAILIPYAHAIDDHQTANAQALAAHGGAVIVPQSEATPERLTAELQSLLTNPETMLKTAIRAKSFGKPDAAKALADMVDDLCFKENR